jgi:hypothetical protein
MLPLNYTQARQAPHPLPHPRVRLPRVLAARGAIPRCSRCCFGALTDLARSTRGAMPGMPLENQYLVRCYSQYLITLSIPSHDKLCNLLRGVGVGVDGWGCGGPEGGGLLLRNKNLRSIRTYETTKRRVLLS